MFARGMMTSMNSQRTAMVFSSSLLQHFVEPSCVQFVLELALPNGSRHTWRALWLALEASDDKRSATDALVRLGCVAALHQPLIGRLRVGCALTKRRVPLPHGGVLEVDGCSESATVLCEARAHQGRVRPRHKREGRHGCREAVPGWTSPRHQAAIDFRVRGPIPATWFQGKSWMAELVRSLRIEVLEGLRPVPPGVVQAA